jgi:hypothetical protein
MVEPTKVSFQDFLLIRDVTMRIESLIAAQMRPPSVKPDSARRRIARGGVLLAAFALVVLLPLFVLSTSRSPSQANPLQTAYLELGFSAFPPVYRAEAAVSKIPSGQKQMLVASSNEAIRDIGLQPTETLYLAEFPLASSFLSLLSPQANAQVAGLRSSRFRIGVFLHFTEPTTIAFTETPSVEIFANDISTAHISVVLPKIVSAISSEPLIAITGDGPVLESLFQNGTTWSLRLGQPNLDSYGLIVHSGMVPSNGLRALIENDYHRSFLVFDVFLILLLGLLVREKTLSRLDRLWIDRLDVPQKLYRMCMAIHLCRDAGDIEREAQLANEFLDLLRSRETILEISSH